MTLRHANVTYGLYEKVFSKKTILLNNLKYDKIIGIFIRSFRKTKDVMVYRPTIDVLCIYFVTIAYLRNALVSNGCNNFESRCIEFTSRLTGGDAR